jgi:DNA-directed RNA polymerase specialized sigma24 family protein
MRVVTVDAPDDGALVSAARDGDEQAFGRLFDRWFDAVDDSVRHIVGDRDVATAVVQDAFVVAWRDLDDLAHPRMFGSWVRRLARTTARDRVGRDERARPDGDVAHGEPDTAASSTRRRATAAWLAAEGVPMDGSSVDGGAEQPPPAQTAPDVDPDPAVAGPDSAPMVGGDGHTPNRGVAAVAAPPPPGRADGRRRRRTAVLVGLAVVTAAVGILVLLTSGGRDEVATSPERTTSSPTASTTASTTTLVSDGSVAPRRAVAPPRRMTTQPPATAAPTTAPAPERTTSSSTTTSSSSSTTTSAPAPPPPEIVRFVASAPGAPCGGAEQAGEVTLTWTSTDATAATVGGQSELPASGSFVVCAAPGDAFTLEITGPGGSAEQPATVPAAA